MVQLKVIAIALLALTLTGCVDTPTAGDGWNGTAWVQKLPDGRSVICVRNGQSISCDWDNAK